MSRSPVVRSSALLSSVAMCCAVGAHAATQDRANDITFFVADQFTYDDNLYRLADESETDVVPPGEEARREDYLQRISAGVEGYWAASAQSVSLTARIDDNQFRYNDDLDHTSGRGKLEWDWRLGRRWSGQLGGDYVRALTDFASSRFLSRDVVDRASGYFKGELLIGSSWYLTSGARVMDIEHSAVERRFDDARATTYTGGIEYHTSLDNVFGWEYRRTESDNVNVSTAGFDRSYIEDAGMFIAEYALSDKTSLTGRAGYLDREYPNAIVTDEGARDGFSGGVWDLTLKWAPSGKTSFNVAAWRSLRAYFDAESDYFVATGGSVGTRWAPTEKFEAGLQVVHEEQEYLGTSINLNAAGARNDEVDAAELLLTYRPRRFLELDLSCRFEERASDRAPLNYDGTRARFGVRINL